MDNSGEFNLACPAPHGLPDHITMAHGGGGLAMARLLSEVFFPALDNPYLAQGHDAARLPFEGGDLAFTTDSYVVQPLFFPGGDIGSLAVHGTVNDLAMAGARPLFLSAGFVLEEGLPLETLRRVVESMRAAADAAGVMVVTGDTKVIEGGGKGGLFINTAGVGRVASKRAIGPGQVRPGDAVLINGDVGRHGMAIMAVREGLEFESVIESDSAPVADAALALIEGGVDVHCLRDLTRGGLASAANEIAHAGHVGIRLRERDVPVEETVRGACELLGFDPLYVANEGRFAAVVAGQDAERALEILRAHVADTAPSRIGEVTEGPAGRVILESVLGTPRPLEWLHGEQLPRIC